MTTVSFEIEPSKVKAVRTALKAMGILDIKVKDLNVPSAKMIERIENAHQEYLKGETHRIDPKNVWESI